MDDILILLSPFYLLPALIGVIFFIITKDTPLIDSELFYQFRKKENNTIHFPLQEINFWGKDKSNFAIFLIPGFNIPLLIIVFFSYLKEKKASNLYFQNNNYDRK